MRIGWIVFRAIDCHLVVYMDRRGAEVGSTGRQFFATQREADQAARRAGWHDYETTWNLMPSA